MFKSLAITALAAGSLVSAISCSDKTIKVQSDGDATALSSCSAIKGNVQLGTGVQVVDLTGVESIGGDLTCLDCTNATSITAPDLTSIGGAFHLRAMINLGTLSMPQLASCGSIQFETLPNLMAMTLGPVTKANDVLVTDTVLPSLDGINVVKVNTFDVNNNRYLKDITMGIETVGTSLSVTFNAKSVAVNLPNLIWANNLTYRDAGDIQMPSLQTVNGSCGIINCTLSNIALSNLTNVGQSLALVSNDDLTKIKFPKLMKIGGGFQISNNTQLTTVDGLDSLASVGGAIDSNGAMKTVKLPKLKDVRGGFNLQTTANNFDCDSFKSLKDQNEIQGSYVCKYNLQQNQVGGYGQNKGGGTSGSSSSNAGTVVVSGLTLIGCGLFSLFYML